MEFKNRVSKYPGRVKITPESGTSSYYATLQRADEPEENGTPMNAETFNDLISMLRIPVLEATLT